MAKTINNITDRRNAIINGGLDFWQRGTSFSIPYNTVTYCADRWLAFWNQVGGTHTVSRQTFAPGTAPNGADTSYFTRWNCSVAGAGSPTGIQYQHRIEGVQTYAGKTVTLSFWAKADAARAVTFWWEQRFGTGGSPSATVNASGGTFSQIFNLTTSFQRFTVTFALPSVVGTTLGTNNNDILDMIFQMPASTTFIIDIAQVMLVEGAEAPASFIRAGATIAGELTSCQRYYEKSYDVDTAPGSVTSNGEEAIVPSRNGAQRWVKINFKTRKRAVPVITSYSPVTGASGKVRDDSSVTDENSVIASTGQTGYTEASDGGGSADQEPFRWHYTADAEL
jgi:hypothetical protein